MGGFHVRAHLDAGESGLGESDLGGYVAVVAVSGGFVFTGGESQLGRGGFFTAFRERLFHSFNDRGAGEGGTGVDVHAIGAVRLDDGSDDFFNAGVTGDGVGFSGVIDVDGSDLAVFDGDSHFDLAAKALGRGFLRFSGSEGHHTEEQAEGQEKGNKFFHRGSPSFPMVY